MADDERKDGGGESPPERAAQRATADNAAPGNEGDAAWRARTQEQSPPADDVAPPTPRGVDPGGNRHP